MQADDRGHGCGEEGGESLDVKEACGKSIGEYEYVWI